MIGYSTQANNNYIKKMKFRLSQFKKLIKVCIVRHIKYVSHYHQFAATSDRNCDVNSMPRIETFYKQLTNIRIKYS